MKQIGSINNNNAKNLVFIEEFVVTDIQKNTTVYETGDVRVNRNAWGGLSVYDSRELHSSTVRTVFLKSLNSQEEYIIYLNENHIQFSIGHKCNVLFIKFSDGVFVPQKVENVNINRYSNLTIQKKFTDITKTPVLPLAVLLAPISFFSFNLFPIEDISSNMYLIFLLSWFFTLFIFCFSCASKVNTITYLENILLIYKNYSQGKPALNINQENTNISSRILSKIKNFTKWTLTISFSIFSFLFIYGYLSASIQSDEIIEYSNNLSSKVETKFQLDDSYMELVELALKKEKLGIDMSYARIIGDFYEVEDDYGLFSLLFQFPKYLGATMNFPEEAKNPNLYTAMMHYKNKDKSKIGGFEYFSQVYFKKSFKELSKMEVIFAYKVVAMKRYSRYPDEQDSLKYSIPCKNFLLHYDFYKEQTGEENVFIYKNCKTIRDFYENYGKRRN